jgi:hypothetical protein
MIKFDLSVVTQIKPSELHIKKASNNYSPKTKLSKKKLRSVWYQVKCVSSVTVF